jgi:hypothetical protein
MEQLIEPIVKLYESEGTGVFDHYGGAAIRRLEAPDEILIFRVDCSASMRQATDFAEINGEDDAVLSSDKSARPHVEGEFYADTRYEDVKENFASTSLSTT